MVTKQERIGWQADGREARNSGKSRASNPYDRKTQWEAWYEWDAGWGVMDRKIERDARYAAKHA